MRPPAWLPQAISGPIDVALDKLHGSSYTALAQGSERDSGHEKRKDGLVQATVQLASRRPILTWGCLTLGVLFVLAVLLPSHQHRSYPSTPSDHDSDPSWTVGSAQQAHLLYIMIPTPKEEPDAELCKSILTAEILQYAPPFVIYHLNSTVDKLAQTEIKLQKILQAHKDTKPLVILPEGPKTWFQLRPEVLIERYYYKVGEENARLAASDVAKTSKVLFLADKECRGLDEEDCAILAKSSVNTGDAQPSYPHAGTIIGLIEDVVPLVTRAHEVAKQRAETNLAPRADEYQHIMASIFVEQLKVREKSSVGGMGLLPSSTLEFGITLDSSNQVGLSIARETDHLKWRQHKGDSMAVKDVAQTMRPFWTLTGFGVPVEKTWHDVKLLTNELTGNIPAVVSFDSSESSSLANLHHTWWKQLWIHPFARKLYDYVALRPNMACAKAYDYGGMAHTFWRVSNVMEKAGAHNYTGKWMNWDKICFGATLAEDVFLDGNGEWVNPAP